MLTVVVGPPAGGKSTWVLEHARPGDVVIDFDRLACALTAPGGDSHDHASAVAAVTRAARNTAIEVALRHARDADVYLIHSSPGLQRMADYERMGATVVTIDPGRAVVRERCKRERPRRMFAVIDEWYREHASVGHAPQRPDVTQSSPTPVYSFAESTSREW